MDFQQKTLSFSMLNLSTLTLSKIWIFVNLVCLHVVKIIIRGKNLITLNNKYTNPQIETFRLLQPSPRPWFGDLVPLFEAALQIFLMFPGHFHSKSIDFKIWKIKMHIYRYQRFSRYQVHTETSHVTILFLFIFFILRKVLSIT